MKRALPPEVKVFIVQCVACYDTPAIVAKKVKEEFGIDMIRQHVEQYDPTKKMGKNLSKRLCDLFYATRKRFNDDITDIAIANKAYRLRVLDRMAADTEGRKNYKMTAAFLEQAAKEVGDAYRRKVVDDEEESLPKPVKVEISVKDARIRDDD